MGIENQNSIIGLVGKSNERKIDQSFGFFNNTVTTNFELYSGGFVGMNDNGKDLITSDINTLIINPIETTLQGFGGSDQVFDPGLKGSANIAAKQYIEAIKVLLAAYVQSYQSFVKLADETFAAMHQNDNANAQLISSAAQEIQQLAQEINVD